MTQHDQDVWVLLSNTCTAASHSIHSIRWCNSSGSLEVVFPPAGRQRYSAALCSCTIHSPMHHCPPLSSSVLGRANACSHLMGPCIHFTPAPLLIHGIMPCRFYFPEVGGVGTKASNPPKKHVRDSPRCVLGEKGSAKKVRHCLSLQHMNGNPCMKTPLSASKSASGPVDCVSWPRTFVHGSADPSYPAKWQIALV